ncbi:hypothetical protein L3Q82_000395 [Scortum barcoo]|uniref:Uncharacterized protein n=1 Tax=Scortum barcoo TaxID=214431 RepID=A0ACB8X956_9TELE|nr:hypothetical protein L3Q82_000395 [Scortum barcoo]
MSLLPEFCSRDWVVEAPAATTATQTTLHRPLMDLPAVVLLFHDQSYGIHYEYTVSLNTTQDRSNEEQREPEYLYIWTHSSWQDCTVQCGGGERRTVVSCMRIANKTMEVVNDSYCQPENRPHPQVRLCNSHPCQYRWVTGEWGSCSVTCGKGLQQREVVCVYHLQNGSLIHTRDLYCLGGRPPSLQGCEGRLCLTVWEASEWSKILDFQLTLLTSIYSYLSITFSSVHQTVVKVSADGQCRVQILRVCVILCPSPLKKSPVRTIPNAMNGRLETGLRYDCFETSLFIFFFIFFIRSVRDRVAEAAV